MARPHGNEDQKVDAGDQKITSRRPHDYWIFERFPYKILLFFPIFHKRNTRYMRMTTNTFSSLRPNFEVNFPSLSIHNPCETCSTQDPKSIEKGVCVRGLPPRARSYKSVETWWCSILRSVNRMSMRSEGRWVVPISWYTCSCRCQKVASTR